LNNSRLQDKNVFEKLVKNGKLFPEMEPFWVSEGGFPDSSKF
jgi:hypothetical protein